MDLTNSLEALWRLWLGLFPAIPERQTIAIVVAAAVLVGVGQAMKSIFGAR